MRKGNIRMVAVLALLIVGIASATTIQKPVYYDYTLSGGAAKTLNDNAKYDGCAVAVCTLRIAAGGAAKETSTVTLPVEFYDPIVWPLDMAVSIGVRLLYPGTSATYYNYDAADSTAIQLVGAYKTIKVHKLVADTATAGTIAVAGRIAVPTTLMRIR